MLYHVHRIQTIIRSLVTELSELVLCYNFQNLAVFKDFKFKSTVGKCCVATKHLAKWCFGN